MTQAVWYGIIESVTFSLFYSTNGSNFVRMFSNLYNLNQLTRVVFMVSLRHFGQLTLMYLVFALQTGFYGVLVDYEHVHFPNSLRCQSVCQSQRIESKILPLLFSKEKLQWWMTKIVAGINSIFKLRRSESVICSYLLHECDVIQIFKMCIKEWGASRFPLYSLKMRMMSNHNWKQK